MTGFQLWAIPFSYVKGLPGINGRKIGKQKIMKKMLL